MKRLSSSPIALGLLMLCFGSAAPVRAQDRIERMKDFLRNRIGLDEDEIGRVDGGAVVTKSLDTDQGNEVAIFGIVRATAPVEYFVKWHEDIEHFESGDAVLAIRKIGSPPRTEDFADLTLPEEDIEALAKCELGDCPVKIGEDMLTRIQTEVDWSSPGANAHAARLIQQMALEGVVAYLQEGDAALGAYRDKKRPTFIAEEFDGLLANSPYLLDYIPALNHYLQDYPHAELEGSKAFLYWSKVKFGLKTTVRLSHIVFYAVPDTDGSVAIASKMLYASHYFHTALELKYIVKDTSGPEESFYLMSLNRSRSDGLTGLFGGLVRGRAQSGALDGLASGLESLKRLVEQGYHAAPP